MTPESEARKKKQIRSWGALGVVAALILLLLGGLVLYDILYPAGLGVRQPIPFSHRVHVHTKHLSCVMCHTTVLESARAGIPPLQTCLLCHRRVIATYPYIRVLRDHFRKGEPVLWRRVNWLPEFVYFNHSVHLNRGVDCSTCHGEVSLMDRVVPARKFKMGFCIQCHRDHSATHDCFTCHR